VGPLCSVVNATTTDRSESDVGQVTVDKLPDNVLLEIFAFYRSGCQVFFVVMWDWQKLVRVCRRWRSIIFASPQRLGLHVICGPSTLTRTSLDIWPSLPIAVCYPKRVGYHSYPVPYVEEELGHMVVALENHGPSRITFIDIVDWSGPALRRFVAVAVLMQSFVALTHICLALYSDERTPLVLPESFLGGSAPRLRSFELYGIAFPSLPRLFLSRNLVYLFLWKIPTSGYISPEAMAAFLAPLSNLKEFSIGFSFPRPRPNQPIPPPLARIVLPALTSLSFQGVSEYLEDLISRIDTPVLGAVDVNFFMDLDFHIPQLNQRISRVERFGRPNQAVLLFGETVIEIQSRDQAILSLAINCDRLDYQVSSMTQLCRELSPYLSFVEKLDMTPLREALLPLQDDMDSTQWLELFHPFIAVQSLWVTMELVPLVAPALQDLTGDRATEVLPALSDLHLEGLEPSGLLWEAIQPFITARQLSDRPVAIKCGELQSEDGSSSEDEDEDRGGPMMMNRTSRVILRSVVP